MASAAAIARPSDPTGLVVAILREAGCAPKQSGDSWMARCPAHGDGTPSLSITAGADGRVLLKCHAGCAINSITRALGLNLRDLFPGWAGVTSRRPAPVAHVPARLRPPTRDWAELASRFERAGDGRLGLLAARLGVSEESLKALRCGWATQEALSRVVGRRVRSAGWTFPMMAGSGEIVGVNVRTPDGNKWTLTQSRLGLFVPAGLSDMPGMVLIVEGASDVAAALDSGYPAVGRPSNCTGAEDLVALLQGRDVLVCGENDAKREQDGRVLRWPGRDGAQLIARRLAEIWGRAVPVAMPPEGVKDFRAWMHRERVAAP